jgi:hypothetical protein
MSQTSHNAPRPRGRPSLTGGRAQTVQTSLSQSQAAWVASRGVTAAAYLRGLVEEAMVQPAQTLLAIGDRVQVNGHRGTIRLMDPGWPLIEYDDGEMLAAPADQCVKIGGDV